MAKRQPLNEQLGNLGRRIRSARWQKEILQGTLAKRLEISQKDMSEIENGIIAPKSGLLLKIEAILGPLAETSKSL